MPYLGHASLILRHSSAQETPRDMSFKNKRCMQENNARQGHAHAWETQPSLHETCLHESALIETSCQVCGVITCGPPACDGKGFEALKLASNVPKGSPSKHSSELLAFPCTSTAGPNHLPTLT